MTEIADISTSDCRIIIGLLARDIRLEYGYLVEDRIATIRELYERIGETCPPIDIEEAKEDGRDFLASWIWNNGYYYMNIDDYFDEDTYARQYALSVLLRPFGDK